MIGKDSLISTLFNLSQRERWFLMATCVFLPWGGWYLRRLTVLARERQLMYPDKNYPAFADFYTSLWVCAFLTITRLVTSRTIFAQLGYSLISGKKYKNQAELDARVRRFGAVCFKFCYFVWAIYKGFSLLLPTDYMPSVLGGSGNVDNAFTNYPEHVVSTGIKQYYLVELGYHLHALIFHLFLVDRRNDFMEMVLHHFCTMFLVAFSYMLNHQRIGALILLVHDMADVFVYAVKASVDTKYTKTTLTIYFGLLSVWGYARLYVFPLYLVSAALRRAQVEANIQIFSCMLVMLQALHLYWYGLFILMGYHFLKKGETVDMQQKVTEADDISVIGKKHA